MVRVHLFELLGSSERKWGVAGVWKIYPVELQDRARLHFPYTTYYHVVSVLQKRLKRQDHPLLIVSIYIYNSGDDGKLRISFLFVNFHQIYRVLTRILKIGVKMLSVGKSWSFTILFYCDFLKSWSQNQKVGVK